jgi:hypothetical protein
VNRAFLRGFAEATGLGITEADAQWAGFSRSLSDQERKDIEECGHAAGLAEGKLYRDMHPVTGGAS